MTDTAGNGLRRDEAGFDRTGISSDAVTRATAFLKALAHEGRLEVLCHLAEGPSTVSQMEAALGLQQSAVSQLLMRLRGDNLVKAQRKGRTVVYQLASPEVVTIISVLRARFCAPG